MLSASAAATAAAVAASRASDLACEQFGPARLPGEQYSQRALTILEADAGQEHHEDKNADHEDGVAET